MSIAYFDCFSGISGDMCLGALVDAGLSEATLRAELRKLPIDAYELGVDRVVSHGIAGHRVSVKLTEARQPERHLSDVVAIIEQSALDRAIKDRSRRVFETLARAEARVHGVTPEQIHFHEVGAVDAIVDVVGTVAGLQALGITETYASSVPGGQGRVRAAHGILPIPAPATLAILAEAGATLRPTDADVELVTPTGAAILGALATFRQPELKLRSIGYGFGRKELPWPNALRLWIGETVAPGQRDSFERDQVTVIETNLDNQTPEQSGAAMDSLLAAGALDVFFTPIQMKKNRPAVKLTVLAPVDRARALAEHVLRETTTLGIRQYTVERLKCRRYQQEVATPWGTVRVKVKEIGDTRTASPEYDDCFRLARAAGLPLADIYQAAVASFREASLREASSREKEERK